MQVVLYGFRCDILMFCPGINLMHMYFFAALMLLCVDVMVRKT